MIRLFKTSFGRLCLALSFFLVAMAIHNQTGNLESYKKAPQQNTFELSQNLETELQEKAEKVLNGFGEDDAFAVVTVTYREGKTSIEKFDINPQNKAVESRQVTRECHDKASEAGQSAQKLEEYDLMAGGASKKAGKSSYSNSKCAENWLVSQKKTKFITESPTVAKISCLVQVSKKNAQRLPMIEAAISTALGFDSERDQVLAVVR